MIKLSTSMSKQIHAGNLGMHMKYSKTIRFELQMREKVIKLNVKLQTWRKM